MIRRALLVLLLGSGVVIGYGSALAGHLGHGGWCAHCPASGAATQP